MIRLGRVLQRLNAMGVLFFVVACSSSDDDAPIGPTTQVPVDGGGVDAKPDIDTATEEDTGAPVRNDISGSDKTTAEAETHLAIAPDGRVLVAWIGFGPKFGTGYAFSANRGASFALPELISGNLGDPIVASGADSSFYIGYLTGTCLGGEEGCSNGHVMVQKAAPGSSTFGAPVDISEGNPAHFYDKPWLMRTGTGSLVAIFNQREGEYPNNLDAIVASRSTDGLAWTRSFVVPIQPKGVLTSIPHACASQTGSRVWAIFIDSTSAIGGSLRWSDDGGATWPAANLGQSFSLPTETGVQAYDYRCAGEGDDVWVMYGLGQGNGTAEDLPTLSQIRVAHSGDAGKTFDRRTTIEIAGASFLRPEIIREPSGGAIDVLAYRGAQPSDAKGRVERFRSTDGGKTFGAPIVELDPMLFDPSRATTTWIGDYSGLIADGTDVLMSFVTNTTGASHIFFAKRPVP